MLRGICESVFAPLAVMNDPRRSAQRKDAHIAQHITTGRWSLALVAGDHTAPYHIPPLHNNCVKDLKASVCGAVHLWSQPSADGCASVSPLHVEP